MRLASRRAEVRRSQRSIRRARTFVIRPAHLREPSRPRTRTPPLLDHLLDRHNLHRSKVQVPDWFLDLRQVADDHDGEAVRLQVLIRDALESAPVTA